MWAPISVGLLLGSIATFTNGRVGVGVVLAVLLIALLAYVGNRRRQSAPGQR